MLYIIDLFEFSSIGHFWPASNHLIYGFQSLGVDVTFINPTAKSSVNEQINLEKKINANQFIGSNLFTIEVKHKNSTLFLNEVARLIVENYNENSQNKIVFSWLPQFKEEELKVFFDSVNGYIETVAGITNFSSDFILGKKTDEQILNKNLFNQIKFKNKILWIWTTNNYSYLDEFIRPLPEFHTFRFDKNEQNQRRGIGFYGILSPFRGLGEFLILSFFNSNIIFEAQGAGFHWSRIWRAYNFRLMRYEKAYRNPIAYLINILVSFLLSFARLRQNVRFTYHPFPTEDDLENAISSKEAIFYFAKLPLSSGIVLTALASGTPVIWIGKRGALVELLNKQVPEGRLMYWELFIPNKIENKLKILKNVKVNAVFSFEDYRNELKQIL